MRQAEPSLTVGVDLGGTKVETALVDGGGRVIAASRKSTGPERGPDGIVADVAHTIEACLKPSDARAVGVGVGVAGQVDPRTGAVRYAPNLRWRDFPLRARLEEAVDLPVWVLNDVQAATYGEWLHGAGRGAEHLVTLFVGTGIGGGVVLDGRLIHGCDGTAGEIGHMKIDRAGPQCTCGRQGCLEAYAGGWAIARRAREALQDEAGRGSVLLEAAGGRADAVTAETVSAAYHLGDPLAARLVEEIAVALATGVASVVSGFNPCLVILGGGVIEGIPALVSLIRTEVAARALEVPAASVRIVTAALGRHAGAVGAAAWARHGGGTARGNPPP